MKKIIGLILLFLCIKAEVMEKNAKIYVAGHNGLVGSAIMRCLKENGYNNLITRSSKQLDLRNQQAVYGFFNQEQPDYVILAAAKVGGIGANSQYKAEFLYDNIMIQSNVIDAAYRFGVKKLLFLGSSCIYPRACPQPIKEEYLLTGPLETTNDAYAIAKITGIKMCQSYNQQYGTRFISCMPTNLYGPHDNFDLHTSHVLPALIAKFYQAAIEGNDEVVLWGTGKPKREFLYVDDLAQACLFLMNHYEGNEPINVGTGVDVTIKELAELIADLVGFKGTIVHDLSKPDGTPRKVLNVNAINQLGWKANTSLRDGVEQTIEWYKGIINPTNVNHKSNKQFTHV